MNTLDEAKIPLQKAVNYHEQSQNRQFRITLITKCLENQENPEKSEVSVNFFVDLKELVPSCAYFEKFDGLSYVEFSTNCKSTWISAPESVAAPHEDCSHRFQSPIISRNFHAFLDSVCPSLYGIRPTPLTLSSIVPVLDMLSHFHSEPLLTNCERFLMSTNIGHLDGNHLIRLLDKGLCVSLDHRILGRILCICLMSPQAKMSDSSQELAGTIGSVFAQAFVANISKSFRHIKPLEQESSLWPMAMRNLLIPGALGANSSSSKGSSEEKIGNKKRKRQECDHNEESFECILCFDQRCGKCKGEAAFCYKALDNFLYEIRLQLYPHTYRPHLDRDLLREERLSDYILRNQFQPLPDAN